MRYSSVLLLATTFFVQKSTSAAQLDPKPQDATAAVLRAFGTHNIVVIGETHGNKQEYEWLRSLVGTPEFADRVDDIVMEFGNSLYQKSVDRWTHTANEVVNNRYLRRFLKVSTRFFSTSSM